MNTTWKILTAAPGVLFFTMGLIWWVAPAFVGGQLGMTLLDGLGRSTQIADFASFFLTMGACILIAVFTQLAVWLYPAIMLLGFAAFGRVLAWAVHDAAFAIDMIAVELLVAALLFVASKKLD